MPGADRRRARPVLAFLLVCALGLGAAGCWDLEEIDTLALIMGLGVDTAAAGELEFVFQIGVPRNLAAPVDQGGGAGGGGGNAAGAPYETVTVRARSPGEAMHVLATNYARRPTLIHNEVLVIGEDLARQGLAVVLGSLKDLPEFRGNVILVTARGRASSLLTIEPLIEPRASLFLANLARFAHLQGQAPLVRLGDFLARLDGRGTDPFLPLIERMEPGPTGPDPRLLTGAASKATIIGAAVFRGDTMVGELDRDETQLALMLLGKMREGWVTLPDPRPPGSPLTLRLTAARPAVRVSRPAAGPLTIDVTLDIRAEVFAVGHPALPADGPQVLPRLAAALEAWLVPRLEEVVRRTQEEFRADAAGFGRQVRRTFATHPEWLAFGWPGPYPEAAVRVSTQVLIRRDGLLERLPAR